MDDLTWNYPILMVLAFAIGVTFYWFLTRSERWRFNKPEPARECPRCKLAVRGVNVVSYRHCPYCGARYVSESGIAAPENAIARR